MDLKQMVLDQVMGGLSDKIGGSTGASKSQVEEVIGAAMPAIIGALGKNVSSSDGASSLDNALSKDHDGSLLSNLGALFGGGDVNTDGSKILSHILGNDKQALSSSVSKKTGVDSATVLKILSFVAPLVLAYLGKKKQQDNLDTGGLADELKKQGSLLDVAKNMLDRNNDGHIVDDILGNFTK